MKQPVVLIEDNFDSIIGEFLRRRDTDLHHRFNGWFRSVVVETNDPLILRRVRVRIPELHNIDVKIEDLPWAIPAPWMGGINAGSSAYATIDDVVFVCFEKNHPYAPIYCSAADPTRRQMYSLWSIYGKTPVAVDENGNRTGKPVDSDGIEEYLPKDNRPMSMNIVDRYGNWLTFNAHGFAPKSHKKRPEPTGMDALAKKDFDVSKEQPKDNDPDTKYVAMGSKYGNRILFADQGYQWFEEFKGDFKEDEKFEIARYQYLLKHFNEEEPKERDQRRIEMRTRLGHFFELRDVGWEKSREGEYLENRKDIGNSMGRDERWFKMRSKGGHLIQALDKGFDPVNDKFYKRLNKKEVGADPDREESLGDDSRMIRFITRHGNQLILDDRGTSPTNGEETLPHGNGILMRTRKGHQLQMTDPDEQCHVMISTSKDQVFEINDRFQYVLMSTTQSGPMHRELSPTEVRERPKYIEKTGQTHDPEGNTYHLKLDKQNCYVRLKTKDGAGFEARDNGAPCGQWTESRDFENRAVWMSTTDNWLLIRGKKAVKYILLDDNDDVILIRNEDGKIQIRAKQNIEIKSDEGNVCIEAPNGEIGFRAKKIAINTEGTQHVIDSVGIGTDNKISCAEMEGKHLAIQIPVHSLSPAPPAPRGASPCKLDPKEISRKKPEDFDQERGCDTKKSAKGPVPSEVFNPPGGGGGRGSGIPSSGPGASAPSDPPAPIPTEPTNPGANPPVSLPPTPDPIEEIRNDGDGVLWYGLSDLFQNEIEEFGLVLDSLSNNLNIPADIGSPEFLFSKTLAFAQGKDQAVLSKKRYGGKSLILRIRGIDDRGLLSDVPNNSDVISYKGSLTFEGNIEIFEVGTTEFDQPPQFPNALSV